MTYGYDSSTPNLTLNLNPAQLAAGRELARRLGYLQTRGANAGQGSLSALIGALAEAAQTEGAAAIAQRLKWTARIPTSARWRSPTPFIVRDPDALPHLAQAAKRIGHVRNTGPKARHGQGSINALVAAIAEAAAGSAAKDVARRLKWLKRQKENGD